MREIEEEFADRSIGLTDAGQDVESFAEPELTPEEYARHTAQMVAKALEATRMFGVIEVQAGVGQAHIMGRVKREKERAFAENVVYPVLVAMERDHDCSGFIGKQYLLRDGGSSFEDMKYAWVLSFASNDIREAAHKICNSFAGAIPKVEVTEGPLLGPGTPQSGGYKSGHRGAAPVVG